MTKQKSTKKTLLTSVLSLVLCIAMLIGTTYAWFTDTATTGVNAIQSGKLDVQLMMLENGQWVNAEGKTLNFIAADGNTNILWEPGCTYELPTLKVVNGGNLTLKYQFVINGIDGNAKLLEVIDWTVKGEESMTGVLKPETESEEITIIGHMSEDAGNEYQNLTIEGISITVYATQMAAEYDSYDNQYDTGATYITPWDGESLTYEWFTGEKAGEYYLETASDLAAFASIVNGTALNDKVKSAPVTYQYSFENQTVYLNADINLGEKSWTPIGVNADHAYKFKGVFDGNGHTIYNLVVDYTADNAAYKASGLFGALNGTVKNMNIEGAVITAQSSGTQTDNGIAVVAGSLYTKGNVDNVSVNNAIVNGNRYVGGIAGYAYGNITNCSVTNSVLTATPDNLTGSYDNGDKVGAITGYFADESIYCVKHNTVSNVSLSGYRDIGGVIGAGNAGNVTDNTVSDITIMVDQVSYSYGDKDTNAAAIVGRVLGGKLDASNTSNNVTIINAEESNIQLDSKSGLYYDGKATRGTYYVYNVSDLLKANEYFVNQSFTTEANICTIELMDDIDLSGRKWEPWSVMWITLNGNNHTISNITTVESWRAGFFGYAGACTINDLTLVNVNSTGAQAGTFAGSAEGLKVNNCYLKGNNTVTYAEYSSPSYTETWGGIGAVTGVLTTSNVNVEIVKGTSVNLNKGTMTTNCTYIDNLTGYLGANDGTVVNNGTVTGKLVANTAASLNSALADGSDIVLADDLKVSADDTTANSGYGATGVAVNGNVFDGNGKVLSVTDANGTWDCAVNAKAGTVKNLTVNGAFRGIFMGSATGDVFIDNVVIDKVCYTFNSDAGSKDYGVYISNSVLNGWTSYSDVHKEVVFTDCTFGQGTGGYKYAFCRPYNNSVFENCVFEEGYEFDTSETSELTFINCYYGDTLITAENAASLSSGETTFFYNGLNGITIK